MTPTPEYVKQFSEAEALRFLQALDDSFDEMLLESAIVLDRFTPEKRQALVTRMRMIFEYGFCCGVNYEMDCEDARKKK